VAAISGLVVLADKHVFLRQHSANPGIRPKEVHPQMNISWLALSSPRNKPYHVADSD